MSGKHEIPDGWESALLGAVCSILDSRRIPVNAAERNERIKGKSQDELYPYYGATGQVGWIDDYLFDGEYVLAGEDGAPFLDPVKEKAYIVSGKFWVNNHAHILKAFVSNRYLKYFLDQVDFRQYVTGTTRLKLNQSNLRKIEVLVPPEEEQHRIVAKIEELFSQLDAGVAALEQARAQLKRYRQALLKAAFEGRLTEAWRQARADELEPAGALLARIRAEREARWRAQLAEWEEAVRAWEAAGKPGKKPRKPRKPKELPPLTEEERAKLPELPEGWAWVRLGSLIEAPKYGTSKKCTYKIAGRGVLRIPNIINGIIDDSDLKYADFDPMEEKIYELKEGDILIIRSNGSISLVGRAAYVSDTDSLYLFAGYLIRLRSASSSFGGKYLRYVLSSPVLRQQIENKAKSTSGVNNINSQEIQALIVPLCSREEQEFLVAELEAYFSTIDHLDQTIEEALARAAALRQAILKKAFSGRLVPQDPEDEPASVLLERISTIIKRN